MIMFTECNFINISVYPEFSKLGTGIAKYMIKDFRAANMFKKTKTYKVELPWIDLKCD